jgi:adrenodoxin-NADP+ reductase
LETLSRSSVKRVHIVGRRGPLQAAFTIKELRELIKLPRTRPVIRPEDVLPLEPLLSTLPRPKKRILQLMVDTAKKGLVAAGSPETEWFLRWPRMDFVFSILT